MSTTTITLTCAQSGTSFTANLNNALGAIDTCHSGPEAPTDEVVQGKFWLDTSSGDMILKIYSGSEWLPMLNLESGTMKAEKALLADQLTTERTVSVIGDASGSFTYDGSYNSSLELGVSQADTLETARNIQLTGVVAGDIDFDGSSDVNLVTTIPTLGTNGGGARIVSTSGPSGGSNGDVWYEV